MKCLLNLRFEGQLVDTLDPKYRLVIKVNDVEYFYGTSSDCQGKISRHITIWDPHPEWHLCFIELTLQDVASKNLVRQVQEQQLGKFVYNFPRKLNQKMTYFPQCSLGKLQHGQIEATCSEFQIPLCDPVTGRSSLQMVPYPGSLAGPIYLSKYFEEFNQDQIRNAIVKKDPWVILLEVHHSAGTEPNFVVYYQSVLTKTSNFPMMPGSLDGIISTDSDEEDEKPKKKNSKKKAKKKKVESDTDTCESEAEPESAVVPNLIDL